MRYRFQPWQLAVLVVVVCVLAVGVTVYLRGRLEAPSELMRHLPPGDGVVVYIDVSALRRAGVLDRLNSTKIPEEPEYTAFLAQTKFDYKQDLDSVLASFQPGFTYILLTGRFNWNGLRSYALSQMGTCHNGFCAMEGSTPERKISFFPLSTRTLALAVGRDATAAYALAPARRSKTGVLPNRPLWMTIPGPVLRNPSELPDGTHLLAKALADADRVTLSFGLDGGRLAVFLDAECKTPAQAEILVSQLSGITEVVRNYIARSNQSPNLRDLSGVITGGQFERRENHVQGRWPIDWGFLDAIGGTS